MDKNKKMIFGIISIAVLIAAASVVQAAVTGAKLDVSLISQEPDPADPGEVIDLRFKVENAGFSPTEDDITFEFIEEYPFSVYSGKAQKNIGSLQGKQDDDEGVIVLYKIKVDENAVQGTNYFDIRYRIGDGDWTTIKDFEIRIRTRDLVVSIESIESTPYLISPGEEFELALTVRNNADSLIRDVRINLDISGSSIPFAPSQSTAEKQIYQINSNTGKIVKFDLVALPDADGDIYKVPINISYTDETGTSYSKDDYISIKVSSTPDLLVYIDSSEIKGDIKSGTVVARIVNRGLTNIKLLTAKLEDSDDYNIISQEEVYVGNIDSDDYETVEFDLAVSSYEKMIELPLELNYMDSTNKKHQEKLSLELKTQSKGFAATVIAGIISAVIKLAILAGIIYGIYWFFKRRRKKKRQG